MSMDKRPSFLFAGLFTAVLTGCAVIEPIMQPLSASEAEAVRAECGLIPPASRLKSGGDFRRRAYQTCKSGVLSNLARNE